MFASHPFMDVDVSDISEQVGSLFNLDCVELEMEILNLQNDIQLKARYPVSDFWTLVDKDKYRNLCTAAMKVESLFGSTYLCESAFSYRNFSKSKFLTHLSEEHLNDSIRVALSNYMPDFAGLVDSMQCQH
ncbi:General transcription factor II-I repeat domain-containing protein 2A [Acipenser ruthenus]|uniref:General transcription factor II-I repeat domain-containing protein 2A n=1 Tax=Acipenser ruthenus TaxID=7906 RepID=A0A444V6K6_ACIRT|nr:General transcription factor II-I repeat domain-containing protein 2A [Acipenser ruthenus]